jgi:hypothetical protein
MARAVYKEYKWQLKQLKKDHWDLADVNLCERCGLPKQKAKRDG